MRNVSPTCTSIILVMIVGVTLSLLPKQFYHVKICKRLSTSVMGTPLWIQFPFYDLKYPLYLLFYQYFQHNTHHFASFEGFEGLGLHKCINFSSWIWRLFSEKKCGCNVLMIFFYLVSNLSWYVNIYGEFQTTFCNELLYFLFFRVFGFHSKASKLQKLENFKWWISLTEALCVC